MKTILWPHSPLQLLPLFLGFPLGLNISKEPLVFTAITCHSLQSSFRSHLPPKSLLSKVSTDLRLPKSNDQLSVSIVLGHVAIFHLVRHSLAVEILSCLGPQTSPRFLLAHRLLLSSLLPLPLPVVPQRLDSSDLSIAHLLILSLGGLIQTMAFIIVYTLKALKSTSPSPMSTQVSQSMRAAITKYHRLCGL